MFRTETHIQYSDRSVQRSGQVVAHSAHVGCWASIAAGSESFWERPGLATLHPNRALVISSFLKLRGCCLARSAQEPLSSNLRDVAIPCHTSHKAWLFALLLCWAPSLLLHPLRKHTNGDTTHFHMQGSPFSPSLCWVFMCTTSAKQARRAALDGSNTWWQSLRPHSDTHR